MQTTLRLDAMLYREAKAEAARQGVTLTRFIEDALRLKLQHGDARRRPEDVALPKFAGAAPFDLSPSALKQLARETQAEYDLAKVAAARRRRK